MEENESNSLITNYLWMFYPAVLFLMGFIYQQSSVKTTNYHIIGKIFYALGVAIVWFIIPLIIVGIRRVFKKATLSERNKLLLFYGAAIVLFIFTIGRN